MEKKKFITSSIAGLLSVTMVSNFVAPSVTTFASKRVPTGFGGKRPVPALVLKEIDMFSIERVLEDQLFDELINFLRPLKLNNGEIECPTISYSMLQRHFPKNETRQGITLKVREVEKLYQCEDIIKWFLSKFTILKEEKFEILLYAYMQATGSTLLPPIAVRNLVRFIYNDDEDKEIADTFFNTLKKLKFYRLKEILGEFKEFTQTDAYLSNVFLY